jgi:hypothetical protein
MTLDTLPRTRAFAEPEGPLSPRDEAVRYLKTLAFDVFLAAPEPLKTLDAALAVMERCGLRAPSEEAAGSFAGLVRLVLDSDPAFQLENRQWLLAARQSREEADRRRPVERAIEELILWVGRPVTPAELAPLVAAVYGRDPSVYETMLRRLAPTSPRLFQATSGRVGLSRWLIDTGAAQPEEVAQDNFDDPETWKAFEPATPIEAKSAVEAAVALVQGAGRPVPSPVLLYLAWRQFPDVEPQALFNDLLEDERVLLAHGPAWITAAAHAEKLATIRELVNDPELAQSIVATTAPAVEEEAAPAVIRVGEADLDQVFQYMNTDLRSFRLTELCQQVLESFPGSRTFSAVRDALQERMLADPRFVWVGTERFRLDGTLPDEVEQIPEGLAVDEKVYTDEEAGITDDILPFERWKYALDEQILHPLVQDFGDDASATPTTTPTSLRATPPLHHYIVGTIYVRNEQRGLLPTEPDLVEFSLLTPEGGRTDVWLNNRLGLLYGLKEWYDANLPWTGGVFTIEPTATPDEFRLLYENERESQAEIPMERLQQLLPMRSQAEGEELTLTEILTRLLKAHPNGVTFTMLFTEVNVVRRCTRALVASVLSAHRGFQQRPDQPGIWFYDERRAEKSKSKGRKPKRIREIEDEEEDLEE